MGRISRGLAGLLPMLVILGGMPASARPLWIDPPPSALSASFAGGGEGHASGVNALLVNPGALYIPAGHEVEAGLLGLSEGLAPYTLYGARGEKASFAFGYAFDRRFGPYRNAVVAGAAATVAPGTSLGGAVRTRGAEAGFGVDADAGLLLRPKGWPWLGDWAALGLSVRNLTEAGVGPSPQGYGTHRCYSLSVGGHAERFHAGGVSHPDLFYEFRAEGWEPHGIFHALSAGAAVLPAGILDLRGTVALPHEGEMTAAFGGFFNFPVGTGRLKAGYAFSTGGGAPQPSHSLSLNLSMGAAVDRLKPTVAVKADRLYVPPDAPPEKARVHFHLAASDRSDASPEADYADEAGNEAKAPGIGLGGSLGELKEWVLSIRAERVSESAEKERPAVKTYRGKDLPPKLIRWDGRDEAGRSVPPGYYAFRLMAVDKAGNRAETVWQLVEIGGAVGKGSEGHGEGRDSTTGEPAREGDELDPIFEGKDE